MQIKIHFDAGDVLHQELLQQRGGSRQLGSGRNVHYKYIHAFTDSLPWSFPRVVRFRQRCSWSHSEHAIGRTNISPDQIFRVIHLFSKPNIFDLSCRYNCVPNTFFEARVWRVCICHKSSIRFNFMDSLIQTKIGVWIFESFCTKLHHGWVCNENNRQYILDSKSLPIFGNHFFSETNDMFIWSLLHFFSCNI